MTVENDTESPEGVPEWCRSDIEDAISDAAMRWVLRYIDRVEAEAMTNDRTHVSRRKPLRRLRFLLSVDGRDEIAAEVLTAQAQLVAAAERPNYTIPDPCLRDSCGYGVPFDTTGKRCPEHEGVEEP